MTTLQTINQWLLRISRWFSYVGGFLILAITVLISYDVVLRYFFNDPMLGAHELVEYMLLASFFLFITDCWNASTHVRMSIVYEKMTGGVKKAADAFVGITGALLFAGMAWKIWEELLYAVESNQVSSELLMPVWPFKLIAFLCIALFVAQLAMSTVIPLEAKKH